MTDDEIRALVEKDAHGTRIGHSDFARIVSHVGSLRVQLEALKQDNERLRFNEAIMMGTIKKLGGVLPKGVKKQGQCDE